jgi:hypothetical protein
MADESNVQCEYNGVPGRREQPDQWLGAYDRIQDSNRPDFQTKQRKSSIVEATIEPAKQPSSNNEFQNSKSTQISPSTATYILNLDNASKPLNLLIKLLV